jgi:RNA polymerase sigma factor (sigma-70 family)
MNSADQFESIVDKHYQSLFKFAISLTRTESDAKDLTQQTFYIWANKGHQLRDSSKVKTWLFTTLHRIFIAAQRRQNKYSHHDLDEVADELPVIPTEQTGQLDHSRVLLALSQLDEVYRAAVALFYLDDWPYKDIASILDVPIGTVKSRIARGIAQLREVLTSDRSLASPTARIAPLNTIAANCTVHQHHDAFEFSPGRADRETEPCQREYAEWDLSSTMILEPFRL